MPRYLYHCPQCRKSFEVEKSMAQAANSESCPTCRTAGERVFTAPGLRRHSDVGGSESLPEACAAGPEGCGHACGQVSCTDPEN